jgi:hypothetical protein
MERKVTQSGNLVHILPTQLEHDAGAVTELLQLRLHKREEEKQL